MKRDIQKAVEEIESAGMEEFLHQDPISNHKCTTGCKRPRTKCTRVKKCTRAKKCTRVKKHDHDKKSCHHSWVDDCHSSVHKWPNNKFVFRQKKKCDPFGFIKRCKD